MTLDHFFIKNMADIQPENAGLLREAAERAIQNDDAALDLRYCPTHLRDAMRRLVIEGAYQRRVRGQRFNYRAHRIWI